MGLIYNLLKNACIYIHIGVLYKQQGNVKEQAVAPCKPRKQL